MLASTAARALHEHLQGVAPSQLTPAELEDLVLVFGDEEYVTAGLALLERIDYGKLQGRRARKDRAHGAGREQRAGSVVGRLPRSLALAGPTSADTHRSGANDIEGRWGPVRCSETLRAMDFGVIAAGLGLWQSSNPEGHPYTETTGGMIAHLITGYPSGRLGGADLDRVHASLAKWEGVELYAAPPEEPLEGSAPRDYAIPRSPVKRVERRLGGRGRWVDAEGYGELQALSAEEIERELEADCDDTGAAEATLRIWWADWVLEVMRDRRAVLINFETWTSLRPTAQTIYAFLQATRVDKFDDTVGFYLAPQMCARLGLRGQLHRSARIVREALAAIRHVDARYGRRKFSIEGKHANTSLPMFRISVEGPSRPTPAAAGGKCRAFRPSVERNLTAQQRAERRVAAAQRRRSKAPPPAPKGLHYVKAAAARLRATPRAGP